MGDKNWFKLSKRIIFFLLLSASLRAVEKGMSGLNDFLFESRDFNRESLIIRDFFETDFYEDTYGDELLSFKGGEGDALEHYITQGQFMNFKPAHFFSSKEYHQNFGIEKSFMHFSKVISLIGDPKVSSFLLLDNANIETTTKAQFFFSYAHYVLSSINVDCFLIKGEKDECSQESKFFFKKTGLKLAHNVPSLACGYDVIMEKVPKRKLYRPFVDLDFFCNIGNSLEFHELIPRSLYIMPDGNRRWLDRNQKGYEDLYHLLLNRFYDVSRYLSFIGVGGFVKLCSRSNLKERSVSYLKNLGDMIKRFMKEAKFAACFSFYKGTFEKLGCQMSYFLDQNYVVREKEESMDVFNKSDKCDSFVFYIGHEDERCEKLDLFIRTAENRLSGIDDMSLKTVTSMEILCLPKVLFPDFDMAQLLSVIHSYQFMIKKGGS